jgi:tetratricopeptide (TPR) repeat protein
MAAVLALLLLPVSARAQSPSPAAPKPEAPPASAPQPGALDEVLLRPRRFAAEGKAEYDKGNHPAALQSFEQAAAVRPQDPRARFNVADGLYKNGKYPEAGTLYKALGQDPKSPVALPSRFNLGNTLFQQQDYKGAIGAYRDALRLSPGDPDTLKNLELSLRELQKQEEQRKKDQQKDQKNQDQKDKDKNQNDSANSDKKPSPSPGQDKPGQDKAPRPQTAEEKEQQRFKDETGMPKERAMQLLEALQQNEKAEQKKLLEAQRAKKKKGKDW